MKHSIIMIGLVLTLLLASCTARNPGPKIEKMKAEIPELATFIENNADSLDTLLQFQSQITEYKYHISGRKVSVSTIEERFNANSRSYYIDICDNFDSSVKEALHALSDAIPEVTITILPDELTLLIKKNRGKDVYMYLSNKYTPYRSQSDVYCEQIDETWYAVLIYAPPG